MDYENKIKQKIKKIIQNNILNKEIVTTLSFNNQGNYKILPDKQNIEIDYNNFYYEMNDNLEKIKKIIQDSSDEEIELNFNQECLKINFLPIDELTNKMYSCLFKEIKKKKKSKSKKIYLYLFVIILAIIIGYYYYTNIYNNLNTIKIN